MNSYSSSTKFSNHCPECDNLIHFTSEPYKGLQIICALCQTELEVIEINPIKLDWAFIALEKTILSVTIRSEGELS